MNARQQYLPLVYQLEQQHGIPRGLLAALIENESGWQPQVRSGAGAIGLGQLMPGTAASLGVDPHDPRQNLQGAAKYLSQQLKRWNGNVQYALASYNAGPGAVQQYGGVPPYAETKAYVKKVTGSWSHYRGGQPQQQAAPAQQQARTPYSVDPARVAKIQHAWNDAPENAGLRVQREYDHAEQAQAPVAGAPATPYGGSADHSGKGWYRTPGGWVQAQRQGEAGYQFLDRLGSGFGLQHDPGNAQTTGGHHTQGSLHYAENAVDYGTGRNPDALLDQWYSWLNQHRKPIGIAELLHEDPGTSNDHIHVGLGG